MKEKTELLPIDEDYVQCPLCKTEMDLHQYPTGSVSYRCMSPSCGIETRLFEMGWRDAKKWVQSRTPPPLTDEMLSKATAILFEPKHAAIYLRGCFYTATRGDGGIEAKNGFATLQEAFAWIMEGRDGK